MSYQSPFSRAKATPLPDSPAGDKPSDDDDNISNNTPSAKLTQHSPTDFTETTKDASARAHLCVRFKNVANLYLESATLNQRSAGDHPGEEFRESAKGQKHQWSKDILEDEGATGLNEVVKIAFLREAEAELQRLSGLGEARATIEAREAWEHVVALVYECRALRQQVDLAMGQFK